MRPHNTPLICCDWGAEGGHSYEAATHLDERYVEAQTQPETDYDSKSLIIIICIIA